MSEAKELDQQLKAIAEHLRDFIDQVIESAVQRAEAAEAKLAEFNRFDAAPANWQPGERRALIETWGNRAMIDQMCARWLEIQSLRQLADAAEQRAADIETRTAVKLGEFAKLTDIIDAECKRLGIEWHGSASTTLKAVIEAAGVKPGWIVFEPTGEVRTPRHGDWFKCAFGPGIDRAEREWSGGELNKREILRRLESPANQAQQGGAIPTNEELVAAWDKLHAEPSPAPAEEPEPRQAGKPIVDGCVLDGQSLCFNSREHAENASVVIGDFAHLWKNPEHKTLHATIREQAAEIERLNKLRVDEALAANEKHRETLQKLREANQRRTELEDTKSALLTQIEHLKDYQARVLDPMAAPQPEAKGASEWLHLAKFPSLPAGDGEADWRILHLDIPDRNTVHRVLDVKNGATEERALDAIAWLRRRTEVEAQLSKYKRDAEAWRSEVQRMLQTIAGFHNELKAYGPEPLSPVLIDRVAEICGIDHEVRRLKRALAAQLEQGER